MLKIFLATSGIFSLAIILFSSLLNIYSVREKIKKRLDDHHANRFLVNPLNKSNRQLPKLNLVDLEINQDADLIGQWSAPIDWNVTAIHSILLPDYSVMTFGSFGIKEKEKDDIRKNKKIKLTDGRTLKRDNGLHQWIGHDVNSGIDFDIWDFNKGFGENSHTLFKRPIVMDSFCSVVRVIDNENVFILGGNKNINTNLPDTQAGTMIYNIKEKKFIKGKNLNFKRWYSSVVRTSDNKLVLIGGTDHVNANPSIIPEILDLNNIEKGWRLLYKAKSKKLFGEPNEKNFEWNYPRSYLASDGNIVGISYNKIWMMDKNDDFRVYQTNEIELERAGIAGIIKDIDINHNHKEYKGHSHKKGSNDPKNLRLLTVGSPVGTYNSTVMIGKDIVYMFGGKQTGEEYSASNKVLKIDFSDSRKPLILKANSMLKPRFNANATILPNGKIFINGGSAYKDLEFSIYHGEIYDPFTEESILMDRGYFRRNYHGTALLLPNGTILVSGGDVWNSEIFYPPYLFTKNWENKTVLADRPKIENINTIINRGTVKIKLNKDYPVEIDKFTIISTGSTTHAQGSEPKFRSLKFSKLNESEFIIDIPNNKNELQDGTYMVFAVSKSGTPSEGKIIYLK